MDSQAINILLDSLNEQQWKVAGFGSGQAAVAGVPGSGKTRAVVARMARLALDGLNPDYMLAMTFTRDAGREMNERLAAMQIDGARVGTIHSLCNEILNIDKVIPHLRLIEGGVGKILLLKVLKYLRKQRILPYRNSDVDRHAVQAYIDTCKATGICWIKGDPYGLNELAMKRQLELGRTLEDEIGLRAEPLFRVYAELEEERAARFLWDYDDMQLWSWMWLLADPAGTRKTWRNRWSVIIVDEAQDSTPIQWDLARFLCGLASCQKEVRDLDCSPEEDSGEHNLMVSGDSSQSIYGWRNANPTILVNFASAEETTLITLNLNYRSKPSICGTSYRLVKDSPWHLAGKIVPAVEIQEEEPAVSLQGYTYASEEAADIIQQCREIAESETLKSCIVLSRLSAFLNILEIECIRHQVPYVKRAKGSFFESDEVVDIMAYLRVLIGADPEYKHLRRLINKPFRYIAGVVLDRTLGKLEPGQNWRDALRLVRRDPKLNFKQAGAMESLERLLKGLSGRLSLPESRAEPDPAQYGPAYCINTVLAETDYLEATRADAGFVAADTSREAILGELQRIAEMFKTTEKFVIYVDQLAAAVKVGQRQFRKKGHEPQDFLTLSTIHRAKGLEYPTVFLADVVQGRMPCSRSDNYEEELRLLYVAITRAKKCCKVSYTKPRGREKKSSFVTLLEGILSDPGEYLTGTSND